MLTVQECVRSALAYSRMMKAVCGPWRGAGRVLSCVTALTRRRARYRHTCSMDNVDRMYVGKYKREQAAIFNHLITSRDTQSLVL